MLASQSQGSIDADIRLVFNKTLSQKSGSKGWSPGPAKEGQNLQNMPSLWRHFQKTKTKNVFFRFSLQDFAESVDGLDSSLAQLPGEL